MKKYIDLAILKHIELKLWLHAKRNGTPWDLFQYGLFWMVVMIIGSILLGKII